MEADRQPRLVPNPVLFSTMDDGCPLRDGLDAEPFLISDEQAPPSAGGPGPADRGSE